MGRERLTEPDDDQQRRDDEQNESGVEHRCRNLA
jgi:hypothetical protein